MIKKFLKFRIVSAVFLASMLFVSWAAIWGYFSLRNLAGPIILHFNNLSGITKIGDVYNLISVGAMAAIAIVVNFFIAMELEERDRFLGKFVAAATLLFAILTFMGSAAIISIN